MELKQMYPAAPTIMAQATGAVSESDTAIYVTDVSVFPAAPNYIALGTDNDFENVLYEGIDAESNALIACKRGQSGTRARAHASGTYVYHAWTSDNANAIMQNVLGLTESREEMQTALDGKQNKDEPITRAVQADTATIANGIRPVVNYVHTVDAIGYRKIATMPASAGYTFSGLEISGLIGGWGAHVTASITCTIGFRSGVIGQAMVNGAAEAYATYVDIVAFEESDKTYSIYVQDKTTYAKANLCITSIAQGDILYDQPITTPTGTEVLRLSSDTVPKLYLNRDTSGNNQANFNGVLTAWTVANIGKPLEAGSYSTTGKWVKVAELKGTSFVNYSTHQVVLNIRDAYNLLGTAGRLALRLSVAGYSITAVEFGWEYVKWQTPRINCTTDWVAVYPESGVGNTSIWCKVPTHTTMQVSVDTATAPSHSAVKAYNQWEVFPDGNTTTAFKDAVDIPAGYKTATAKLLQSETFRHSADEQWTGEYAIDGRKIYIIHRQLAAPTAINQWGYTDLRITNLWQIQEYKVRAQHKTSKSMQMLPYNPGNISTAVLYDAEKGMGVITNHLAWATDYDYYAEVKYTCTDR